MLARDFGSGKVEAGCDEAGRGPLAGPVVAAAVILPTGYEHPMLDDSKKLNQQKLDMLEKEIKEKATAWKVIEVSPQEIDEVNILNASFLAMHRAIDGLASQPELLLIDGNRFPAYKEIEHQCIVKGDGKYMSIAAASILAKTHRDRIMRQAAQQYPGYGWETNFGYPTKKHREAIRQLGITPLHRRSFRLLPEQMELF